MGWFNKDKPEEESATGTPPERSSLANLAGEPPAAAPPKARVAPPSQTPASPSEAAGASVFAETVDIEGSLEGHGDVVLHGTVRGSIHVSGSLLIEESGRVQADVAAKEVVNAGTVEGNITAGERVRVAATGVVNGDIDAPSIVIDDGGGVEGFIQMEPPGGEDFDAGDDEFVPPAPIRSQRAAAEASSGRPQAAPGAPPPRAPAPPPASGPQPGNGGDRQPRTAEPGQGVGGGNGGRTRPPSPEPSPLGESTGDAAHPSRSREGLGGAGPLPLGGGDEALRPRGPAD